MQNEGEVEGGRLTGFLLCRPHTPMIRFRKGLDHGGGEPTLTHRASPTAGLGLAAAPSPQQVPASAVLTGASSGAAASAGALGMEQSCTLYNYIHIYNLQCLPL
jgi:hypothetical protein